jgi:hypothetical protein
MRHVAAVATFVIIVAGAFSPACASAQELSDEWKFRASIYMWMPTMSGGANLPGGNTADIDVKFHTLFDHLKMAGMGTFEAQKGRWGAFTDVIYMDLGGTKTTTRNGTIDGVPLPVGAALNTGLDIKAWIWTLAGSYRMQAEPGSSLDVFAGARMLWLQPRLNYEFSVDVGPFVGPNRSGSRSVTGQNWDGIVGVKGRTGFGANREWFIPYYLDIGTGQSDLTWQAAAGIGYAFSWGEIVATWRYLDYNQKANEKLNDLTINGPLVGVAFRW